MRGWISATVICVGWGGLLLWQPAIALESMGPYAEYLPVVSEDGVSDGDIVTLDEGGYRPSNVSYDPRTYGVVDLTPAVAISVVPGENKMPVITTGTVSVNVSAAAGAIKAGDFIATSEVPGVGVRANNPGVVLGTAMASFDSVTPEEIGQIAVALNIHFAVAEADSIPQRFSDQVRQAIVTGAVAATSDPNTALRYAVAAAVMIISLIFGLLVFGRLAISGVTAIGRNPLARRSIILGISFNVLITIAIVAGGVIAAFFILAL